ncbi:MAG TPA: dihydrodipicolinate synthase family protein [Candidatus Binataceae bacterium]|nr:dihydrodipicolinate synthase family protein [Candidatus Binataceae bacterium]
MTANLTTVPREAKRPATGSGWLRARSYRARAGLSTPIVTVLDKSGRLIADEQRSVIRYTVQNGTGANIVFAVGTTGEWNRLDNTRRQAVIRITVEECGRLSHDGAPVEAWAGITAETAAQTIDNLEYSLEVGADAAVVAPLSIADVDDPVAFVTRTIGEVFERHGRTLPIFLYDNADIAIAARASHISTGELRQMARLSYVHGIKVTASKEIFANYARPPGYFKLAGGFAIYPGNAYLIFDLFRPWEGFTGRVLDYWSRYLGPRTLPYGVVAGASNVMPREWQRSWQVCHRGNVELMQRYEAIMQSFRVAGEFIRSGEVYKPTIACLKTALADLGVISSDAVASGTPTLDAAERREFLRRFRDIRRRAAATLEPEWLSEWTARSVPIRASVHG